MPWRTAVVALLCVAVLAARIATLSAHHSHANYDVTTWTVMEGTVKQLVLMAPHSIVYLEVKDDKGTVATWALEATNQRAILNNGVKREDVRPGDHVKVRCHLLRDGAKGCLLGFITPMHGDAARGNGVEIEWD
ncbi:MAG TPA: DUF6152 family protein [Vicinamibacterales bacterium]|jgi:hypothetical protein|nr:DUF6152 family protein [Vicinamibacterales bacterium]